MKINSIRFKTSILYTSILCVILIIFSCAVFCFLRDIFYRELDQNLQIKANEISNIFHTCQKSNTGAPHPTDLIKEFFSDNFSGNNQRTIIDELWHSQVKLLNLNNDYVNILDEKGNLLVRSENIIIDFNGDFLTNPATDIQKKYFDDIHILNHKLRIINHPIYFKGANPLIIQVGTSIKPLEKKLKKIGLILVICVFIILSITSFLGGLFAKKILSPVMSVANAAKKITYKDLNVRVQPREVDIEMRELIDSFNSMIERLEKSFIHINEFSSHVAHELKTPLAIIKGELELALTQDKDTKEYKRVISESLTELNRMIKIIQDLLLLAKFEYNPDIFSFEEFNFIEYMEEIFQQSKVLAVPKNIEVSFEKPKESIFIKGEKLHLRRLFINLISNAIQYTPAKGRELQIAIEKNNKEVRIDIADTGCGISEENLPKIFKKFFRVDRTNSQDQGGGGVGLGLNIARSIAKAHGGDIVVSSQINQGTTFSVILPI